MSDNPTTTPATGASSPPNAEASVPQAAAPHDNNVIIAVDDDIDDGSSISHVSTHTVVMAYITETDDRNLSKVLLLRPRHYRAQFWTTEKRMDERTMGTGTGLTNKEYVSPNDEQELDRLDLQHNIFIRSFDGRLGTAPPNDPGAKVGRVLDVGTGTGIWAIDFGEEHPEADVLGIDLSPPPLSFVPPNVKFVVDDAEEPWIYSQPFDYIHSRMMTGSIANWEKYVKTCFDNLTPGGYLELTEADVMPLSDDGTLTEDTSIMKALRLWSEGLAMLGSPFEDISRLEGVMKDAGFEDVHVKRFKWPMNSWPKDPKYKELGMWNYENIAPNWEGFLMATLTRTMEWTKEEVLVLAMEARKDSGNKNIHAYYQMWSIHGRKPLKTEEDQPPAPTTTTD
ncbi:putative methyltransferase domain-containing protein [Colletotrichum sublineola]|uniref:Putative methyltransferase domain-containing protein n=1 Tax=Colletotrichum sublineola TaxID=1173701 RepID=A0A066X1R8_COLSU|nr:putative methyltransferase domain-containing protein [Colletotrichum sublineola]